MENIFVCYWSVQPYSTRTGETTLFCCSVHAGSYRGSGSFKLQSSSEMKMVLMEKTVLLWGDLLGRSLLVRSFVFTGLWVKNELSSQKSKKSFKEKKYAVPFTFWKNIHFLSLASFASWNASQIVNWSFWCIVMLQTVTSLKNPLLYIALC